MGARTSDPNLVEAKPRRVVVGSPEAARNASQIASGVLHFGAPVVALAWFHSFGERDLDLVPFNLGWGRHSGVDFGLGLCDWFVEFQGEFPTVR